MVLTITLLINLYLYKSNSLNTGDTYLLSILAFLHCTRFLHQSTIINQIPVQMNRIKNKTNKHKKPCCMSDASGTKGHEAGFFPFAFSMSTQCKALKINTLIENNITSIHAQ